METNKTMTKEEFKQRQQSVMLDGIVDEPVKVNYTDTGSGPTLVLLHGIPTWSYLYQAVIPELEEEYRVIVPDLLGYGYSDQRDRFDRSLHVQAKLVVRLMEKLELGQVHLAAHDIGGGVGLILALNEPERIDKLVLSNTVAYDSWPIEEMLMMGHPSWKNKSLQEMEDFLSKGYKDVFAQREQLTDTFLQGITAPYLHEEGKVSLVRNAAALNTNETTSITHKLSDIQHPVLLLWGTQDPWQPVETGEMLDRDLPDSRLVRVNQSAHWVPQEAPKEFAAEIKKFI
ncbi:Pimeloyl-ACP methyl ester carboxylesterase [Marinococcus luteus]|uniref:Pimeloyl-ACP methyl ester carboxylesterase n=1 Tax=Marinococcus luteus TaxID=1122204 RepID=A0A1H2QLI6_9BACI|nr:alpha/beta hydrolase [Marinococcus luteus]SDW07758.1 Pimeloyl-ACP methyl ester carboxylesterase [Marinococcus luteus]